MAARKDIKKGDKFNLENIKFIEHLIKRKKP